MKDHLYLLECGTMFTSPWVVTQSTIRRTATIVLTARGAPFEMRAGGVLDLYRAVAVKPLVERAIRAEDVCLLSVQIAPLHPQYRAFRAIPAPGLMPLPRDAFAKLDDALQAAYAGQLATADAARLFEDLIAGAVRYLPRTKPADPRTDKLRDLLRQDPDYPLEQLAATIGLSYVRMSRLFAESVGISLRSYQLWQKLYKALMLLPSGQTLTDIAHVTGFTDLAHLSRTFQQAVGAPLSYFLDKNYVKVFKVNLPTVASPPPKAARRRKKWNALRSSG